MSFYPAGNYMFKVNNRNTRARCEICSKLAIKIPERRQITSSKKKVRSIFDINFSYPTQLYNNMAICVECTLFI